MISRQTPLPALLLASFLLASCHGENQGARSVLVSLPPQEVAGVAKATIVVDYSGTGARILANGSSPDCAIILPGIEGQFSDDHQGSLTIHTSGPRALRGPADIAACRMETPDPGTTAEDLQAKLALRVSAAEDAAGKPIDLAAAKSAKAHGGGDRLSDSAVEAAQQQAVEAAANVSGAAASAGAGPAPGNAGDNAAVGGASSARSPAPGSAQAGGMGQGGGAAAPPSTKAAPAAKPASPGTILRNPVGSASTAGSGGSDNGSNVGNGDGGAVSTDKDPGYDDTSCDAPGTPAYNIEVQVTSPSRFAALQIEITHLGRSGCFIGRGDQIDCTPLVEAIVAGNYPGERIAKLGLISLQGVQTPAAILRCGFRTPEALSPASFLVQITDASDVNSDQLEPPPTVAISSIMRR